MASKWSDSEETIAAVGLSTTVAVMTAISVWPRGPDALLNQGAFVRVAVRPAQ